MDKTIKVFFFSILMLTILSCKKNTTSQFEKIYSEKMDEWILPNQYNYLWYKYKFHDKSSGNIEMKRKIYYFRLNDDHFGTLSASFLNGIMGISELGLFEKTNNEVFLLKSKNSSESIENTYSKLLYFQFPADNDTLRWSYSKNDGIYNCSSFWLLSEKKEKQLVVVREAFPNGSTERFEKDIEYYQKYKGLVKIKMFGSNDNLLMSQTISERGVDPEVLPEKFPLIFNQENQQQ